MQEYTLNSLFRELTGHEPHKMEALPGSGSNRKYYRITGQSASGKSESYIGVEGTSASENQSFIYLSGHFRAKGLNVPEVLITSKDHTAYIQEDLGDTILYNAVSQGRKSGDYSPAEVSLLKDAIAQLPRLQFLGGDSLDWSKCYPQEAFDSRMVDFDLNYFKYCYLKPSVLEFNENQLQDDFDKLKATLLQEQGNTFMYRDFQARNIMLKDGRPWFIDFQGGRRGPIYYDVASFIWQASSRFPATVKEELLKTYLNALGEFKKVYEEDFRKHLKLFVLFRTLQVLGAYGFRGLYEKKPYFIASIPPALENLSALLPLPGLDYLSGILGQLCEAGKPKRPTDTPSLEVKVFSFSFKKGIPADDSGNGGGYVFDCRAINNPGRYEFYRQFNGTDPEVIKFLEDDGGVNSFLDNVYSLVDAHAECFIGRGFTSLQVSFGCTGGQHRSVYCAQHLARHLKDKYGVKVILTHRELGISTVL